MIAQSVAEIISRHVRLTVEGIDRMYLNVFVPGLQYEQGIVQFFRTHRGQPLPSAALMSPMTRAFVAKLEDFVADHGIPLVQFEKGQRKDAVMADHAIADDDQSCSLCPVRCCLHSRSSITENEKGAWSRSSRRLCLYSSR